VSISGNDRYLVAYLRPAELFDSGGALVGYRDVVFGRFGTLV
jgi:hypothetical protein